MTVVNDADAFRKSVLGVGPVSKAYSPLVVETKTLFTVSGLCMITTLFGVVTTAITVANTVKLQANPTVGASGDFCSATDLGTTDTPAGNLLAVAGGSGTAMITNVGTIAPFSAAIGIVVAAGTIEQVTATGADGGITWYITYVPLVSGATIVAA